MRYSILLLSIVICFNIGCNRDNGNSGSADNAPTTGDESGNPAAEDDVAEHPATTVANQILAAIQAGDAAAIRPLLNATNQKMSDNDIAGMLKEIKETIGEVSRVSELREGRQEESVMAKIRVVGDEVFVVVMTFEGGEYRFEDINSPSVEGFEAASTIVPK